ncbi:MAG: hypothetical protein MUE36_12065 [Acidimicrobiales bacterium]|jgi:Flp pilus assembly pilin Flp|nr:hypothetical protein [Acidimicrobiales bacterium]
MSSGADVDRSDEGASLVEYALLLALIAVVCLTALAFFGDSVFGSYDGSGGQIASAFK